MGNIVEKLTEQDRERMPISHKLRPPEKTKIVRLSKETKIKNSEDMENGNRTNAEYNKRKARTDSASSLGRTGSAHMRRPETGEKPPKSILKKTLEESDEEINEDEWDTDLEEDLTPSRYATDNQSMYRAACRQYGIVPMSAFSRQINDKDVQMNNQGLGPKDAMAVAIPLLTNTTCTNLQLAGNDIGVDGIRYITEMMFDNVVITQLNLANNNLRSIGAKLICKMLQMNGGLQSLNVSGNNFSADDAHDFAEALKHTFRLTDLDLSHNDFGEKGGAILGQAIAVNDSIEKLNLSWNSIRLDGAKGIAKGLQKNLGIKNFDLSWNGFGTFGAQHLCESLKNNRHMVELDLSSNRIDAEGAAFIAKGIKDNDTLEILKLSKNPLTDIGAKVLLQVIKDGKECALRKLEIYDVHLEKETESLEREIQELRPEFSVSHGVFTGGKHSAEVYSRFKRRTTVVKEERPKEPLEILLDYVESKGINLMELFAQFDQDNSWSVSRDEFKEGMKQAQIPLNNAQMEKLLDQLDSDGDGEVDFGELMFGSKEFKDKQKEREEREKREKMQAVVDVLMDVEEGETNTADKGT